MPQSILPESSIIKRILGSTELLRNNGESASVPGADCAVSGLNNVQLIAAASAAALRRVRPDFVFIDSGRRKNLENASVMGPQYDFCGIGIATGRSRRNSENRDITRSLVIAVPGQIQRTLCPSHSREVFDEILWFFV